MTIKPIDPLEVHIWEYEYIKYAVAIHPIVPSIKKLIYDSDNKLVIISAEDIIKEMGTYFKDKNFRNIYTYLKFVMFTRGIAIKSGFHISGKRIFIMRFVTYGDHIPKSWRKRSRLLKKLMKSAIWKEIESRVRNNS
jgi:hypothetical protein